VKRSLIAAALALLASTSVARACALDQVPSMSLNGELAIVNGHAPTTAQELARWAPFVFRVRHRVGKRLWLAENRREVGRSLTVQAMSHAALWRFGDGQSALGWRVSHMYRKPATYRITVLAYDRGTRKWYEFDAATVVIAGR
jgi:hypothetical protein